MQNDNLTDESSDSENSDSDDEEGKIEYFFCLKFLLWQLPTRESVAARRSQFNFCFQFR